MCEITRRGIIDSSSYGDVAYVTESKIEKGYLNVNWCTPRAPIPWKCPHSIYRYVKQNISLAPNNPSAWNYLRGILKQTKTPFPSLSSFVLPYTRPRNPNGPRDIVDLENPPPSEGADLPAVEAMEFLADILEEKGSESDVARAVEVRLCLMLYIYVFWSHLFCRSGSHSPLNMTLFAKSRLSSLWQTRWYLLTIFVGIGNIAFVMPISSWNSRSRFEHDSFQHFLVFHPCYRVPPFLWL